MSTERRLFVFGSNGECQLGIPAADIVTTPTQVLEPPPLENVRSIQGGDNHTVFLADRKIVYCAGDNRKGQAFHYIREGEPRLETFMSVYRGAAFIATTCESSAFIIHHPMKPLTSVRTQGYGQWGEVGCGEGIERSVGSDKGGVPTIDALSGAVIDFAAGVWHYIAVLEDGTVYGWGKARLGQLGEKNNGKVSSPTRLENIPFKPVRVTCGKDFTYLVGDPSTGEHVILGQDKFNIISNMPSSITGWKDIGATWNAIFVLFEDGKLIAWGRNSMWEVIPPNLPLIEKIAVGSEHVLAVTKDGKLISWGWGKHGNCGDLSKVQDKVKNDTVSGFWNEIDLPGEVEFIAAGYCTSFVITK
ncbi:RCC1/BLIP-II, partial [Ophiobolus disseminans]